MGSASCPRAQRAHPRSRPVFAATIDRRAASRKRRRLRASPRDDAGAPLGEDARLLLGEHAQRLVARGQARVVFIL
jgi:hypothetical protein